MTHPSTLSICLWLSLTRHLLQIKYCVRTAKLLAHQSKGALNASHLYTVLDLAQEFGHELAKEDTTQPAAQRLVRRLG
jgi:hypothetical protein